VIHDPGHPITVLDNGGGCPVYICDDCWELITQERCVVCGRRCDPSRACGMYKAVTKEGPPDTKEICDDCREHIVFDNRGAAEYFEDQFPDDFVTFEHWREESEK